MTGNRAASADVPEIDTLAREASGALNVLIRTVDSLRHRLAQDAQVGMTELRALNRIAAAGTMSPKQLADSLDLTTGTVTALLDRMERAELVTRAAHPTDRRMLQIQLTPLGAERLNVALTSFDSNVHAAARTMPPEAVAAGAQFLQRVTEEIERHSAERRRAEEHREA
jgi:DNA-binding MarR family transcriptional regulator